MEFMMLPNPFNPTGGVALPASGGVGMPTLKNTLNLNQVEGFQPIQEFKDDNNTCWRLVKAASNSTIDIPDPKSMQVLDYWNHEFPGLQTKLYVYVVEGIKQPRVETEQPTRVLYQWFSSVFVPTFTPMMITDREWLKANVYAAPVINARLSKLNAICHIPNNVIKPTVENEDQLLKVEELSNGNFTERNTRHVKKGIAPSRAVVSAAQNVGNSDVSEQHNE